MTLRGAVIGCGRIGSTMADDPLMSGDVFTHAEGYVRCDDTELVALCDTDPARLDAAGRKWGVDALFTAPRDLMATASPDLLSICTPTSTHRDVLEEVLESIHRPRIVLCEKPLASNLSDAEWMVRAAADRRVMLATIYMRRFARNHVEAARLISSRVLGPITAISGWYIKGTVHNGTHWFDMLRQIGEEVSWVEAHDSLREGGDDPTLDVLLGLRSGPLATLRAAPVSAYTVFEMDILCEQGRVSISDAGHHISLRRKGASPRYTGYDELRNEHHEFGDRRNLMLHAVRDAAAAAAHGTPLACTGEDGLAALLIADAALRSHGARIYL